MSRPCPATLRSTVLTLAALATFPAALVAQRPPTPPVADSAAAMGAADMAMGGMKEMPGMTHDHESATAMLHMRMTPPRAATHDDSTRARTLATEIRAAIARYADTSAAVADGYRMFLPQVKQQRIYHFTSWRHAVAESFRFDPARPTSILYERRPDGLHLVGAMYTMPRRTSVDRLDERIPLSIARWHQHVDWCLPPRGATSRWSERRDGKPLFGPESPIATKSACDAVGGQFHDVLFGWMIHANVFAGDDLATIFGEP